MPIEIVKMDIVPEEIKKQAREICRKLGHTLVYISKLSVYKQDNYLYFIVARYGNTDAYTTWIGNSSGGELSFNTGHYNLTFKRCLEIWANNINMG